ncbi:MAG: helix-turn-helix transcriptional regulator [Spirochaetia bacterium]
MLHAALALYLISFSLGITALVLSFMAYARYGRIAFRDLAVLIISATLIQIVDMVKIYDMATTDNFGILATFFYTGFFAVGCGILTYMIPALCFRITDSSVSSTRNAWHIALAVTMGILGGLREVIPGNVMPTVVTLGLVGVQAYGVSIVFPRLGKIEDSRLRFLIRLCVWLVCVMMAAACVEIVVRNLPGAPQFFRYLSIVGIAYFFIAGAILVTFALLNLFKIANNTDFTLPDAFVQKYGISPRECQIISRIVQGFSNRKIGEELFISSITVKNHIYHIYQKTGVENKIQLLNLINPPK